MESTFYLFALLFYSILFFAPRVSGSSNCQTLVLCPGVRGNPLCILHNSLRIVRFSLSYFAHCGASKSCESATAFRPSYQAHCAGRGAPRSGKFHTSAQSASAKTVIWRPHLFSHLKPPPQSGPSIEVAFEKRFFKSFET